MKKLFIISLSTCFFFHAHSQITTNEQPISLRDNFSAVLITGDGSADNFINGIFGGMDKSSYLCNDKDVTVR